MWRRRSSSWIDAVQGRTSSEAVSGTARFWSLWQEMQRFLMIGESSGSKLTVVLAMECDSTGYVQNTTPSIKAIAAAHTTRFMTDRYFFDDEHESPAGSTRWTL